MKKEETAVSRASAVLIALVVIFGAIAAAGWARGPAGAQTITVTSTLGAGTVTQTVATTVTETGPGATVTRTVTSTVTGPGAGGPYAGLKVLLILPIDEKDNSWNRAAFDALNRLKQQFGFELSIERNLFDGTKAEPYAVDYAKRGYQVIIGHGIQYMLMFHKIAPDYPNTMFVCIDCAPGLVTIFDPQAKIAPNVYNVWLSYGGGGFIIGYAAGKLTKSNIIGLVGGGRVPSIWSAHEAMKAGIHAANPNAKVLEAYMALSWADVAGAKKAAETFVAQGADIVLSSGDGIDVGVVEASLELGFWTSTVYADLPSIRPELSKLIGSIVVRWDVPIATAISDYVSGKWHNGFLTATMSSGDVTVSPGPSLPPDIRSKMLEIQNLVIADNLWVTFDFSCFPPENSELDRCKPTAAQALGFSG